MILNIKATNSRGETFAFDRSCRIVDGLDLSGLGASVNSIDTTAGGASYQGTRLLKRNKDITFHLLKEGATEEIMDMKRERLYRVFNPETNPIRLDFENSEGIPHYMHIEVQATPFMPPSKKDNNAAYQRGLIQYEATDPYIYVNQESQVGIAAWVPMFKFDLKIPTDGIEVERRQESLVATIDYTGTSDTGVLIRFMANGTVVKPEIQNIVTFEKIKLNFTMQTGDIIEINTEKGKRYIRLTRAGVTTNIFYTYTLLDSTFITLKPGENAFTYEAESGKVYLDVYMNYRTKKVGL